MTTTLDLAGLQAMTSAQQAEQAQQVQLVEVLAAEEYEWAHLPGAINVPLREIGEAVPEAIDASRPVVVYCHDSL